MYARTAAGKKIIFQSIWASLALTLACWGFSISLLVLFSPHEKPFTFWGGLLLFGFGAVYNTYRLLSPHYTFIRPGSERYIDYAKQQFEKEFADTGVFSYSGSAFTIALEEGEKQFDWQQVQTLIGYKTSNSLHEVEALQVIAKTGILRITEETPGWYQFLARLRVQFPVLPLNADWELVFPDGGDMPAVLYDKLNRPAQQVLQQEFRPELDDPDATAEVVFVKKESDK